MPRQAAIGKLKVYLSAYTQDDADLIAYLKEKESTGEEVLKLLKLGIEYEQIGRALSVPSVDLTEKAVAMISSSVLSALSESKVKLGIASIINDDSAPKAGPSYPEETADPVVDEGIQLLKGVRSF